MRSHNLQGPRPESLEVSRGSKSIKESGTDRVGGGGPVVVYLRSPKVVHVEPEQFMVVVQRLTGNNNQPSTASCTAASCTSNSA